MDYPLIMICGESGTGKSYSFRNLNKEKTKIINIENKILPFKDALNFKHQSFPESIEQFNREIENVLKVDQMYDVVVVDSFAKFVEMLLEKARLEQKGYEIYNYYNAMIRSFLNKIKRNKRKFIVLTSLPERVEFIQPSGAMTTSRRVKVSGKEHEGSIEKEFTIVLFTDVRQEKDKGKNPEYRFITNNDGTHSAKSPPNMFGENKQYIDNDLNMVINKVKEYYGINNEDDNRAGIIEIEDKPTTIPVLTTYQK